jgi:molybdopterin molybdotransferase
MPGQVILKAGHLIRPAEIGIIASLGFDSVLVSTKPRVGIITTGSEIVKPGQRPAKGQIYDSNAYSLSAQVIQAGGQVTLAGIAGDDKDCIKEKITALLAETEIILISGGVSMGDFDFVPGILKELNVHLHFDKIAVQPGKPTVFGTRNGVIIFGLPGNPVSTFIIFEILVKKVILRLMDHKYSPLFMEGIMKKDFRRKRADRTFFVPVFYDKEGLVDPVEYHGSAHLTALSRANALLMVPMGINEILTGSSVHVRQI